MTKDDSLDAMTRFRLSTALKEQATAAAQEEGMPLSTWLRVITIKALKKAEAK